MFRSALPLYTNVYRVSAFKHKQLPHPNPFTSKSDQFQISPALHQKYYVTQYEERSFSYSFLRWEMIILPILTTSPVQFSLQKGWESVLLELGNDRVNHYSVIVLKRNWEI